MKYYLGGEIYSFGELIEKMTEDLKNAINDYDVRDYSFIAYDYNVIFKVLPIEIKNRKEMYELLYRTKKAEYILSFTKEKDLSREKIEDMASRKANLYAVKNTEKEWTK